MLATRGPLPANDADQAYELKWLGVRAAADVGTGPQLRSRADQGMTGRCPEPTLLGGGYADLVSDGALVTLDGEPSRQRITCDCSRGDAGAVR